MSNTTTSRRAHRITDATFDPRLKTYTFWGTTMFLVITIVGIAILPFWLIFGKMYVNRYYDNLFCELTTRALHFKKGIWFQTERTIPLDKIQDLTFKEGPLLRHFGLSYLKIETAGQSVQGMADMTLTGIVNARNFREMVLDQRDLITDKQTTSATAPEPRDGDDELITLLKQIHETLLRIEQKTG
jgi:membrane protein YdbS with pleckstrin-like domain